MPTSDIITIDGPAASGKSTVAKRVAGVLGRLYVDSGALYRAVTWEALRKGIALSHPSEIIAAARNLDIHFSPESGSIRFAIGGVVPSADLRSSVVAEKVSEVAAIPLVREEVVRWLRRMPQFGKLVVEGRDIGSAVFPDAEFKFYLDASPKERARRRHAELTGRKEKSDLETVFESLKRRDRIDSARNAAPLVIPEGAVVVDTTAMAIDEVANFIVRHVAAGRKRQARRERQGTRRAASRLIEKGGCKKA